MFVFIIGLSMPPALLGLSGIHAATETPNRLCLTADDQYFHAESLFQEREFPEAVVEFKRFIRFFADDTRIESAWYYTGMSFYQAGQYLMAIESFQILIETFGETPLGVKAHHRISESHLKLQDPGRALIALFNLATLIEDPAEKDAAYYQAGWIYVETAQWDMARAVFQKISPHGRNLFDVEALLNRIETHRQLPKKDPHLAGLLAVVPGAGHLYCERYRDAFTALIVNGLFAWAAYEAFDNERPALGSLLSVAGFGFYSGSIFGSVSSAHKFNQNQTRRFIDALKREKKVAFSASVRPGGVALMAHFPF